MDKTDKKVLTQYINKAVLVAEIRSRLLPTVAPHGTHYDDWDKGANSERVNILSFIDSVEVKEKEVDLEKEICSFFSKNPIPYEHITDWPLLKNCAIHFFELGLQARKPE